MGSDKKTVHSFEFYNGSKVGVSEYPLSGDGSGRVDIELDSVNSVYVWDSFDGKEGAVSFSNDEVYVIVKTKEPIMNKLLDQIKLQQKHQRERDKAVKKNASK